MTHPNLSNILFLDHFGTPFWTLLPKTINMSIFYYTISMVFYKMDIKWVIWVPKRGPKMTKFHDMAMLPTLKMTLFGPYFKTFITILCILVKYYSKYRVIYKHIDALGQRGPKRGPKMTQNDPKWANTDIWGPQCNPIYQI